MWPFTKKTIKKKQVMYNMFGGWGNRIEWQDIQKRTVCGWKRRRPEVGDLLKIPMASGKDGVFRFKEVTYCNDPLDMFFGELEPVGYLCDYAGEYTPESDIKVTFLV